MTLRWPLPATELVLAPRGGVGVVLHDDRQADAGLDLLLERLVAPVDVGGEVDRRPLTVDVTGRADADTDDLVSGSRALDGGGDGVHDPLGRARGRHLVRREDVAFLVDHTGRDLGTADVDADGESHESLSFGRAPLRPTVPEALRRDSRRPPGGRAGVSPGRCVLRGPGRRPGRGFPGGRCPGSSSGAPGPRRRSGTRRAVRRRMEARWSKTSGLRSMTGSTAALACRTTWLTICWAAPPATAPSNGDCSPDSFSATVSTSLRSSSAAEPGGGPYFARRRAFSATRSSSHAVAQASESVARTRSVARACSADRASSAAS